MRNASDRKVAGAGGMQGWPMVTAVVLAVFSLVPVFLTSALAPRIRADFPLTEGHLGIAVSAFFAASAVGNLGLGPVADRFGGIRVLRLFSLPSGCALGFVAVGARSWVPLAVALAVAGLGNGGVQTAANEILVHSVSVARQGFAFGVKQAAIPAATLLAGLAVPAVGASVGWRWAFAGAAA
ncbi:MAG TPA: MFS transporter, partial [Mycobacteriales bacterium]|nr:MFS transporter [Mycobacteriales bacterium]